MKHTNFKCVEKKKKDGEIDQNRSRKWKLNKRVRNNIKEMPQIYTAEVTKSEVDQFIQSIRWTKNKLKKIL